MNLEKFSNLMKPGQIAGTTIKNRIVMSPLGTTLWGMNSEATDRTIDHYEARAKGGVGLITVSFAIINCPPVYNPMMAVMDDHFLRLASQYRLVEAIHSHGTKAALQLMHLGRQGKEMTPDLQRVSSSDCTCIWLGQKPYPPARALTEEEIHQVVEAYAESALNARRVGYDMVELHGAHGYLINSFISPFLNHRSDQWGGTLENRMRFPVAIIQRIKEVVGRDFPVGVRISGDEFVEGGVTIAESPAVARSLEQAGADYLHVSSGIYESLHKSNDIARLPEGWKSYIWEAVKKAVTIPTIAAGGNRTPGFCESILAEGKADFIALGRQLFADPEWANKVAEGRADEIRRCFSCMECLGIIEERALDTRCSINVAVGREKQFGDIQQAAIKKKVVVVGAGPAGMEAARIAAMRGHQVRLYDRNHRLGGLLLLASVPPGKEKLRWFIEYQEVQLERLGVTVFLGTKVTADFLAQQPLDAVVVATGSQPIVPRIPGLDSNHAVIAWDVLRDSRGFQGGRFAVCGGGMVGVETAELLADAGNQVTIVEMLEDIAGDMESLNRKGLIDAIAEKGVQVLTSHKVVQAGPTGVWVEANGNGRREFLDGCRVVIAVGSVPETSLGLELAQAGVEVHTAGDCRKPRNIMAAVYEGALAGMKL
ncbi:MAG: FAD-dependent oxidoreductase [Chloroflexi bacterium]|nr:FAD-dependent oxidoreductase [Chloroflexota bacterium]